MKEAQEHLDKAQKLMLLQGISLIHDGLQFIEWADELTIPTPYTTPRHFQRCYGKNSNIMYRF